MNGNRLFLDTNIIIYLLSGDRTLAELINGRVIYVSFITQLELLSYHALSLHEEEKISYFLSDCVVVDVNNEIKNKAIDLRKAYRLKLPDSIIIATALHFDLPLVTSDSLFNKVEELETIYYEQRV